MNRRVLETAFLGRYPYADGLRFECTQCGNCCTGPPGRVWFSEEEGEAMAENLGVDVVWSAEAWGRDAVVPLAFIAARTHKLRLGTGIMQVCARTPAMVAMTALSMNTISNGRFLLGLGNSGPQVVEGLGLEARPPHPKGYEMEPNDLGLLDGAFFRDNSV